MSDAAAVQLIVGLGNPGEKYLQTRHNAGFWFVDELARRCGGSFRSDARYKGELTRVTLGQGEPYLLKPMTYMNRSGDSVGPLAAFYKLEPSQILVVHDELDLPHGTMRLKRGGGHGGHNGLRDIARVLGTRDFLRLRVGIGHPGAAPLVTSYVLSKPSPEDREAILQGLGDAADVMELVVAGELDKAMNRLHS
ncbi:MAG: aminoacyl-tRNA hydrolase [Ectothiorhodospiraceae bacterium]|nr:aminoacyl-tRNA hydrolase [Ectothiorhodospiraceae bacterium]